ncbi:hypothetical protein [Siminovitchia terrae]|uniref:hypothetical protein n=1 Tax=Siminovitchia terrae TaxID=1914933 RepID=UPI0028AF1F6E|nr:hypothetical protein [Siminovitchia terrae]
MYKCGGIASEEDALLEMIERGELIGVKPMDIERKRREKKGLYDKQEILKLFSDQLDEVEEFSIVCKYKNGEVGSFNSSKDIVTTLGMLEAGKIFNAIEE